MYLLVGVCCLIGLGWFDFDFNLFGCFDARLIGCCLLFDFVIVF